MKKLKLRMMSLLLCVSLFCTVLNATARPFVVNTLSDLADNSCDDGNCSLRDAINLSTYHAIIRIEVSGTIRTSGLPVIGHSLTIVGPGENDLNISGSNESNNIFTVNGGDVTMSHFSIVENNSSYMGAIFAYQGEGNPDVTLKIKNMKFLNNINTSSGAAIFSRIPTLIEDSKFIGNEGGAIYFRTSQSMISHSQFKGNKGRHGAAINYDYINVHDSNSIVKCEFTENQVTAIESEKSKGGALYVRTNLDINQTLFKYNTAFNGNGGAIYMSTPSDEYAVNIVNSTFFSNIAYGEGGAIYNASFNASILNISFSTLTQNSSYSENAEGGGGIYNTRGGKVRVKNSLISYNYDNFVKNDCYSHDPDAFVSFGGNIYSNSDTCSFDLTYDFKTQLDQVEILADNGGPTETCAPRENAVIVNTARLCYDINGNRVNTDQRGVARNDGKCDVGAFEVMNSASVLPAIYYLLN